MQIKKFKFQTYNNAICKCFIFVVVVVTNMSYVYAPSWKISAKCFIVDLPYYIFNRMN